MSSLSSSAAASTAASASASSSLLSSSSSSSSSPAPPRLLLPRLPIFEALLEHAGNPAAAAAPAIVHSLSSRSFSYADLPADVCAARDQLLQAAAGGGTLTGKRIAFLVENSYDYVVTFLAVLAAGAIAVPLSPAFPTPELQYIADHCEISLLAATPKFLDKAQDLLSKGLASQPTLVQLEKHLGRRHQEKPNGGDPRTYALDDEPPAAGPDGRGPGMMLYTSGTTSRPKGVLLPQSALTAQCRALVQAWEYSRHDRLLHVLPLHHIHGTINGVLAPLFAGSTVEFLFPFNADAVWQRLAAPFLGSESAASTPDAPKPITFLTAVPTVYSRLLATSKSLPADVLAAGRTAVSPQHMRVAISGSAALPTPIKQAWADLSHGTVLLERYGMTEIGMALSCGLDPADRVDASVGWPLPGVDVRLVDVDSGDVIPEGDDVDQSSGRERVGEIQVRGPSVFREYWNNPEATRREFVPPSPPSSALPWFKTGDVAVRRPVPSAARAQPWTRGPMFFIQGRISADIIKTGGEKVSALEVERELLALAQVAEAAVVAVPSGKWGQKVGAIVVLADGSAPFTPLAMRRALKPALAAYKIPQVLRVVDHIPRNAMGKINKKDLVRAVFAEDFSGEE